MGRILCDEKGLNTPENLVDGDKQDPYIGYVQELEPCRAETWPKNYTTPVAITCQHRSISGSALVLGIRATDGLHI